jgi:predicted thioesterase
MRRFTLRPVLAAVSVLLLMATAACGGISQDDLEEQVANALEGQGERPDSVTCEDGLEGEEGETQSCEVTHGGQTHEVTVTVTEVDGNEVQFQVEGAGADDVSYSKEQIEEQVANSLEAQVGQRPDDIECPDGLAGEMGETLQCVLTAGADQLAVTVTVTGVEGDRIDFDVQVAEG